VSFTLATQVALAHNALPAQPSPLSRDAAYQALETAPVSGFLDSDELDILTAALNGLLHFEHRRGTTSFIALAELDPSCNSSLNGPLCLTIADPPAKLLLRLNALGGCFRPTSQDVTRQNRDRDTGETGQGFLLDRPQRDGADRAFVTIHREHSQLTVALRKDHDTWLFEAIRNVYAF
jgi:hypothetical protein